MDHFRNLMGLVESACETEVSSGRTRATWFWWKIDLNLENAIQGPRVLQTPKSRTGATTLMKQWNKMLQCGLNPHR